MEKDNKLSYVVVDDEEGRCLLRLALKDANRLLPICEFSNGQQLLDCLTQNQNGPTGNKLNWIVVLGVNTPCLNGLKTLKLLQRNSHWSTFPVIILANSADLSLIKAFYFSGAKGYVTKPNSPAKIVEIFDLFIAPLLMV